VRQPLGRLDRDTLVLVATGLVDAESGAKRGASRDGGEMIVPIALDLAIGLNAGHPQDVQLCLTLVRCEIGREMADWRRV